MGKKINFKQMHSVIINSKPFLDLCFFAFSITFNALSCLWSFSMTKYVKQSCVFFWVHQTAAVGRLYECPECRECLFEWILAVKAVGSLRAQRIISSVGKFTFTHRQTDRRTSCKCKVFRFKFIIKIEFWLSHCVLHSHTHICIARESLIKFKFCMRWY